MSLVRANLFTLHRKLFQTVALGIKSAKEMFLTPTVQCRMWLLLYCHSGSNWIGILDLPACVDMKHQSCSLPTCWASKCCQVCLQRVNVALCVDVPHKARFTQSISCGRNTVVHIILQYLFVGFILKTDLESDWRLQFVAFYFLTCNNSADLNESGICTFDKWLIYIICLGSK